MSNFDENPIWTEKYRPRTIDETILPQAIKNTFNEYKTKKVIPNLLLSGTQGLGKTTVAKALLAEIDSDYVMINGSLDRNIDTLRNEIMSFASTMSFTGKRKFVILDEADGLNADSTMKALRGFMEEFSSNCGFILTCNVKSKIIEPIHSRCAVIDFRMPPLKTEEGSALAAAAFKRMKHILEAENVEYDPKVVVALIRKHYPDFRRLINELQRASANGKIDAAVLSMDTRTEIEKLVGLLRSKNFREMRSWVEKNSDISSAQVFRSLYDKAYDWVEPSDIPNLVLLVGEYSYKSSFVADTEINLAAFLTQVMAEISFKDSDDD